MSELIFKDECYAIVGAAFAVYNELGPGFLEAVYHEAMEFELADRGIRFVSKPPLLVHYRDRVLSTPYEADFLCYEQIVVELKGVRESHPNHEAQLIHYLKAANLPLGILINFGHYSDLQYKRIVRTHVATHLLT
jgi:GxxExxY protein